MGDHVAVAAQTMDAKLVHAIIEDPDTADISDELRATLYMLERLTKAPNEFGPADIPDGVEAVALEEAMLVCFVFSTVLRFVDSFGFPSRTAAERAVLARNLMRIGYALAAVPGRSRPGPLPNAA